MRLYAKLLLCDWNNFEEERTRVFSDIQRGLPSYPFICLALAQSPEQQLRCATLFGKAQHFLSDQPLWHGEVYSHDRIRIAYLSADFREHATANSLIGIFEHHDRSRFEVTGVSFGPDSGSAMVLRIKRSCERFIDVQNKSDRRIAELLRELEIDIAVDTMGLYAGRTAADICATAGANPSKLSGLFGVDGSGIHRLRHRRRDCGTI